MIYTIVFYMACGILYEKSASFAVLCANLKGTLLLRWITAATVL